ncbi:efflux RND transporter periplasmic adaptor subunit [Rikenella microfusus]|uniref:efflux RND transporter periplasmic adaptor subunit n=1 Tax=Rikenella microfusus TaxID=28139 RepID=UPI00248D9F6B|nr:HlyD family efflux transporter periplasmic adaptor subunit [Rikenella microfusus]
MDSQIPQEIIDRRKRKRIVKFSSIGTAIIVLFIVLVSVLRSGIDASAISTAVADRGALEVSVTATGKVVPLFEEIIASPVASKVLEVYRKSGEQLQEGDTILRLDLAATNTDFERQRDELEMKRSKIEQQRSNAETQLSEMAMQIRIDSMRLRRAEVQLRNERYLDSIGASTADKIRQAELELAVQAMQYDQLKLKYANLQKNTAADLRVTELDYNIARKNFALATKTMGDAQVRAPRAATLTWVNDQIGSTVAQGAQLAIVSDLSRFRIEGEIADSYAEKVAPGNQAVVEIGSERLTGIVGNVVPAVANGLIKFSVILDQNDNPKLRSGLKADVFIINSVKDDVVRIPNRSYYRGPGRYELWGIADGVARKRSVELGESSYEYVEVVKGLEPGETVIVSDMSRFKNEAKLKIRN